MVNIAQQIGGSLGLAVFSSLGTTAIASYLAAHSAATTADAGQDSLSVRWTRTSSPSAFPIAFRSRR